MGIGRRVWVVMVVKVVVVVEEGTVVLISLCRAFIWFRSCGTISIGTFLSSSIGG